MDELVLEAQDASPRPRREEPKSVPEAPARFMRVCPYCAAPLTWRLFGADSEIERPFCLAHGPLRIWRIVDWKRLQVVSVGHISEDACGRMLATPLPLAMWRPASARWQIASRRFFRQPLPTFRIDLSHLAHPPANIPTPPAWEQESRRRDVELFCRVLKPLSEQEEISSLISGQRLPPELAKGIEA